jgi:hypothetical protein
MLLFHSAAMAGLSTRVNSTARRFANNQIMVEIANSYTLYFPINYKSRAEITLFQDFLRIFAK